MLADDGLVAKAPCKVHRRQVAMERRTGSTIEISQSGLGYQAGIRVSISLLQSVSPEGLDWS